MRAKTKQRRASSRVVGWFAAAGIFLGAGAAASATTRIVGSDLLGPALAAAIERYAREHGSEVDLEFAGTRPALAQLQSGRADVALLALPPGELPPGDALVSRQIAAQPIVVLVPESVPLTQITLGQVRGVFALGATENVATWGELGLTGDWRTRAISAHAVSPAAALTLPLARRLIFNQAELKPTVVSVPSMAALPPRLLAAGSGLALTPAVPASGSGFRAMSVAASVTEPAYQPTPEHLHSGAYAWRLPLYLTVRREAVPRVLPLLRFILGDECRRALADAHFLPLPINARNQLVFELEELR